MNDYSLIRLFPSSVDEIVEHIKSLPKDDLYLRFGYNASSDNISAYVNNTINSDEKVTNYWFGINTYGDLIATIHISICNNVAEFAFTTCANHRGKKLGQLLFARGYQLVVEYQIDRIFMVCLTQNKQMMHIANKFGLSVMTHGSESEGTVNIQYPVPLSRINEIKMCIIDKNLFTR